MTRKRILCFAALVGMIACGRPDLPYETAGIAYRSSGGDEVISDEGAAASQSLGVGLTGPIATRDEYQQALQRGKARREAELSQIEEGGPIHHRLEVEIRALDDKAANVELSFLEQRNAFVLAEGSLNTFVYQFAGDREWETNYAMRSGDIDLAASIVRDVLSHLSPVENAPVDHIAIAEEEVSFAEQTQDEPIRDLSADRLKAENLGAEVLLRLAQLAIEAGDYGEAERQFLACLNIEVGIRRACGCAEWLCGAARVVGAR
ncbi:MAG: hypothetical protein R2748_27245 [Bryobacterales bacterium]